MTMRVKCSHSRIADMLCECMSRANAHYQHLCTWHMLDTGAQARASRLQSIQCTSVQLPTVQRAPRTAASARATGACVARAMKLNARPIVDSGSDNCIVWEQCDHQIAPGASRFHPPRSVEQAMFDRPAGHTLRTCEACAFDTNLCQTWQRRVPCQKSPSVFVLPL